MSQASIEIYRRIRSELHSAVKELSSERLHAVPAGFDNNIAWNIGHLLVVQQRLIYARCGLPLTILDEMNPLFMPGTSPADWQTPPDAKALVEMLMPQHEQLERDFAAGLFSETSYELFTPSSGVAIDNINDALVFNIFHESQHFGFVLALINLVG